MISSQMKTSNIYPPPLPFDKVGREKRKDNTMNLVGSPFLEKFVFYGLFAGAAYPLAYPIPFETIENNFSSAARSVSIFHSID